MSRYRKLLVAIVTAVAAAIPAAISDGEITAEEWTNLVILAVGAAQVWNAANTPTWRYGKAITATLTAVAVLLASSVTDELTMTEFVQLAIATAGALGVREIANKTGPEFS